MRGALRGIDIVEEGLEADSIAAVQAPHPATLL